MTSLWAQPGQVAQRYRQGRLLGRGGAADVFEAHDVTLDRRVALKVLRDVDSTERFRVEAQTLARLRHPGLVTVLDAGELDGRPFLVMELVEGVTLADCCRDGGLEPHRLAAIGAQLAETLEHVHENGIIHRDVKPSNILVADDGRVLLADFGIARLLEGSTATETGLMLGTAAYLSPEQVRGEPLTAAVDIYSLGLVLLESLTGERAFTGPPLEAALARLQSSPDVPEDLPAPWRSLLAGMISLQPEERPSLASAAETLRTLAEGLDADDAARDLLVEAEPADPTVAMLLPEDATRVQARPTLTQAPPLRVRRDQGLPALSGLSRLAQQARLPDLSRFPRLQDATRSVARQPAMLLGAIGAFLLVLLLVVPALTGGPKAVGDPSPVPDGVPSVMVPDLERLHDAVEGR